MFKALKLALAVTVVGLAGLGAKNAQASFTVVWDFPTSTGTQTISSTPGSGVSGTEFVRDNLPSVTGTNAFISEWDPSLINGTADGIRFDLTITGQADITQISLNSVSSADGPTNMAIAYSGDSFAAPIATWTSTGTSTETMRNLTGLNNLTGTFSFLIYSVDSATLGGGGGGGPGGTGTGGATFSIASGFTISGTVISSPTAIPEPTSLLMVAAAGLAGGFLVRRRKLAAGQAVNG